MKVVAKLLFGGALVFGSVADATAQIRVPSRPVTVPNSVPAKIPPPAAPQTMPTAPTTPTLSLQNSNRRVASQIECVYRPPDTASLNIGARDAVPGTATIQLVCMMNSKPTTMTFKYAVPKSVLDQSAYDTIGKIDQSGFAIIVSYVAEPVGTGTDRTPTYEIVGVSEGSQSRQKVICTGLGTSKNSINLFNPQSGEKVVETWCSDGQMVVPTSLLLNNQLQPGSKSLTDLNASVDDSYVYIEYELATGAGGKAPYLIRTSQMIKLQGGNAGFAGPSFQAAGLRTCELPGANSDSQYCTGLVAPGKANQYVVYGTSAIRFLRGANVLPNCETIKQDVYEEAMPGNRKLVYYNFLRTTCTNRIVTYKLLPGMVPAAARATTQGGCYIAVSISSRIEKTLVRETYSKIDEMIIPRGSATYVNVGPITKGKGDVPLPPVVTRLPC